MMGSSEREVALKAVGLSATGEAELTEAARRAINKYLRGWAGVAVSCAFLMGGVLGSGIQMLLFGGSVRYVTTAAVAAGKAEGRAQDAMREVDEAKRIAVAYMDQVQRELIASQSSLDAEAARVKSQFEEALRSTGSVQDLVADPVFVEAVSSRINEQAYEFFDAVAMTPREAGNAIRAYAHFMHAMMRNLGSWSWEHFFTQQMGGSAYKKGSDYWPFPDPQSPPSLGQLIERSTDDH